MHKSRTSGIRTPKAIVTGGAGFIGSNLCRELAKTCEVISIDDYSAGHKRNLDGVDCRQLHCDVSDKTWLKEIAELTGNVDYIFHNAAAKKNVCLNNPLRDMEINIKGAFNVAHIAKMMGAKLIHASTGSVYGEAIGVQGETHPLNPVSNYGVSKLAGEKYAAMICPDAAILRYFHVYGPNQESADGLGGVVAIWRRRIEQGKHIVIYGDGTQRRSFTYVGDIVKANIEAAKHGCGVYNVVSGYMYDLHDLLREMKEMYGDFEVKYEDWLEGDIKDFTVDNTKIRGLGMQFVGLSEGLKKFGHKVGLTN